MTAKDLITQFNETSSVYVSKSLIKQIGLSKAVFLTDLLTLFQVLVQKGSIEPDDYMIVDTEYFANLYGLSTKTIRRMISSFTSSNFIEKTMIGRPPRLAIKFNLDNLSTLTTSKTNKMSMLEKPNLDKMSVFNYNKLSQFKKGLRKSRIRKNGQKVQFRIRSRGKNAQIVLLKTDKLSATIYNMNNIIMNNIFDVEKEKEKCKKEKERENLLSDSSKNAAQHISHLDNEEKILGNLQNFGGFSVENSQDDKIINQEKISRKNGLKKQKNSSENFAGSTEEQKQSKNNKKKAKKQVVIEFPLWWNDELQEAWEAFLEMRKTIKKPATPYAQKMAIKKLIELSGNDPEKAKKIIEQSIFHNWQGFFELKEKGKDPYGNNDKWRKINNRKVGGNMTRQELLYTGMNPDVDYNLNEEDLAVA